MRLLIVLALLAPAPVACGSSPFVVEDRDTPMHVWVTAPDLARADGGSVDLLIYVAGKKVVEGPVRFSKGVPTIKMPTVFARSGPTTITAILRGGTSPGRARVTIDGESWIQVIVRGQNVTVRATDTQPNPWG